MLRGEKARRFRRHTDGAKPLSVLRSALDTSRTEFYPWSLSQTCIQSPEPPPPQNLPSIPGMMIGVSGCSSCSSCFLPTHVSCLNSPGPQSLSMHRRRGPFHSTRPALRSGTCLGPTFNIPTSTRQCAPVPAEFHKVCRP